MNTNQPRLMPSIVRKAAYPRNIGISAVADRVAGFLSVLKKHRSGFAAFLIPLAVRAVPEIIAGPYPIGWDTIAFYVPNTLDWASGRFGIFQMMSMAPLVYAISVP